jgi:hypothetical protein
MRLNHEALPPNWFSDLGLPPPVFMDGCRLNGREGMILDRLEGYAC